MFDEYMPQPEQNDAALGWIGYVGAVLIALALVRLGVFLNPPTTIGQRNSIAVVLRGEGNIEVLPEGKMNSPQYCSKSRCILLFAPETKEVVITYQLGMGFTFQSWGGACAGADSLCRIPLGDFKTVRVNFERM